MFAYPSQLQREAEGRKFRVVKLRRCTQGDSPDEQHPHRDGIVDRQELDRVRPVLSAEVQYAEERLRYYASQFPLVEVDSSYYALPKPEVAQLWAERTPATSRST